MLLLTLLCAKVLADGWTKPGEQCQCSGTAYNLHNGDEMTPMCEYYDEQYGGRSCTVRQGTQCTNPYVKVVECIPKPGWKDYLLELQKNQQVVYDFQKASREAFDGPSRPAIDQAAKAQDSSADCEFEVLAGFAGEWEMDDGGDGGQACSTGFSAVTTEEQCKAFYDFHSDVEKNKIYEAVSSTVMCFGCQEDYKGGVAYNSDATMLDDPMCKGGGLQWGFQKICVKCSENSVETTEAPPAPVCDKSECTKPCSGKGKKRQCKVTVNSVCSDKKASGKGSKKKWYSKKACKTGAEDAKSETMAFSEYAEAWNANDVMTYGFAGIGCVAMVVSCVHIATGKSSYKEIPKAHDELP